jgi:hypothetical protein
MIRIPCALFLLLVFAAARAEGQPPAGNVRPPPPPPVRFDPVRFDPEVRGYPVEKQWGKGPKGGSLDWLWNSCGVRLGVAMLIGSLIRALLKLGKSKGPKGGWECTVICSCGNEIGLMLNQTGQQVNCPECPAKIAVPKYRLKGARYDAKLMSSTGRDST